MCIAFIKRDHDKLLVALNRDEYRNRPTRPLSFIEDKNAYAGVDERFGGTWFALNQRGSFALVTNIRNKDLSQAERPTRGELPFLALSEGLGFLDDAGKYNPFNLLWGDRFKLNYFNNIEGAKKEISENLYALTNCAHPCSWPKSVEGKKAFKKIEMDWDDERIFESVFKAMKNSETHDFVPSGTGFDEEVEKKLSPIFVDLPDYGTVSTTVMLAGADGVRVEERRWASGDHTKFIIR